VRGLHLIKRNRPDFSRSVPNELFYLDTQVGQESVLPVTTFRELEQEQILNKKIAMAKYIMSTACIRVK